MENDTLLQFRIRSVRSRKRTIRKDVEKQIRKKYKRSTVLWHIKRNQPLIPLETPYQLGFVRFFVVRDDVLRDSDGAFFEGILKKINTYMYSESRQFLKKRKKFGRRIYVEKKQKLNRIPLYSWCDPKFGLTPRERRYFLRQDEYCPFRKGNYDTHYEFIEPWRFTLRVRPHMITHYKPVDAELEKEYAELESYLQRHKIKGIIQKTIHGKSNPWRLDNKRDLIKSRKYVACAMSATELVDYFLDL